MTNNPKKIKSLEGYGLIVKERFPLESIPRPENIRYLLTKCQKMGHLMELGRKDIKNDVEQEHI
jgi:3,4-dihydroxy 2-butanone 4-phosphate synthase/GTP cyclohydrolase II